MLRGVLQRNHESGQFAILRGLRGCSDLRVAKPCEIFLVGGHVGFSLGRGEQFRSEGGGKFCFIGEGGGRERERG